MTQYADIIKQLENLSQDDIAILTRADKTIRENRFAPTPILPDTIVNIMNSLLTHFPTTPLISVVHHLCEQKIAQNRLDGKGDQEGIHDLRYALMAIMNLMVSISKSKEYQQDSYAHLLSALAKGLDEGISHFTKMKREWGASFPWTAAEENLRSLKIKIENLLKDESALITAESIQNLHDDFNEIMNHFRKTSAIKFNNGLAQNSECKPKPAPTAKSSATFQQQIRTWFKSIIKIFADIRIKFMNYQREKEKEKLIRGVRDMISLFHPQKSNRDMQKTAVKPISITLSTEEPKHKF